MLSRRYFKQYKKMAIRWGLDTQQTDELIKMTKLYHLGNWDSHFDVLLTEEQIEKISQLLAIDQLLRALLRNDTRLQQWLRKTSTISQLQYTVPLLYLKHAQKNELQKFGHWLTSANPEELI